MPPVDGTIEGECYTEEQSGEEEVFDFFEHVMFLLYYFSDIRLFVIVIEKKRKIKIFFYYFYIALVW